MHSKVKELIDVWNKKGFINKKYKTSVPFLIKTVKAGKDDEKSCAVGEYVVGEDYIAGKWKKWNSNSGAVTDSGSSVQAFCHWTYHYTKGELVMCDAQGVRKDGEYCITDPCICSINGKSGLLDCGEAGINSFFANHKCNNYCRKNWEKPKNIDYTALLPKRLSSTYQFEDIVKTQNNKIKCNSMIGQFEGLNLDTIPEGKS